jgi:catechol 2,3-dioxygenase-like lactoylglutathione lyase family enzyme
MPVDMFSQFVVRDSTRWELLAWPSPGVHGEPSAPRNQLGLTHLCFGVDDVDEVAMRLASLGETILEETRTKVPAAITLIVVKDSDGTRVELVKGLSPG